MQQNSIVLVVEVSNHPVQLLLVSISPLIVGFSRFFRKLVVDPILTSEFEDLRRRFAIQSTLDLR